MNVKKICAYAVATFLILTVAFRLVAGEGFESGTVTSQMVREKAVTPEILTNTVLEQVFVSECDRITEGERHDRECPSFNSKHLSDKLFK